LNPESLAATRWKEIRQAHEQIAKAERAQAKSQTRLQELRVLIGPAELRDRAALGQALVEGKAEPASEAAKLKAELEQEERNAEALALAVQSAHGQVAELVAANRREWRKETLRELSRAVARYRDAITEVEDAREALSSEATLVTWLDSGAGVDAATDQLGGRVGTAASGRAPVSFSRMLEELRADAERLAGYPASHDDPPAEPRLELAWGGRR
jgi:Skp family chaperone for outer membrane proteins